MGRASNCLDGGLAAGVATGTAFALSCLSLAAQPASGHHAPWACSSVPVEVAAASAGEREVICRGAGEAIARLRRCGIAQRQVIRVEVSDVVRSPLGTPIFGRFDLASEVVFVVALSRLDSLIGDLPYRDLPRVGFYRSLVVHEVVHALMHQNYRRQPASRAAWEYPAYAIQFESILDPQEGDPSFTGGTAAGHANLLFNDIILGFDPFLFARMAYEHFASSTDGCANLRRLLAGDVEFVVTLP